MIITKVEKKIVDFCISNHTLIFLICVSILGFIIRYDGRLYVSDDATYYLLPWFEEIAHKGGINSLNIQIGNYGMLYQLIIALFTYIPLKPLYCYKFLSIIFDYALAISVAHLSYMISAHHRRLNAVLGYSIVLMSPIVIMNSAIWAQCDSIYTFFCICALCFFLKEKYGLCFIHLGIAFAFKLQTIFILPFFVLFYLLKRKFSLLNFIYIPTTMIILAIPNLLFGRTIPQIFDVYRHQVSSYQQVSMNYPSPLLLFSPENTQGPVYDMLSKFSPLFITFFMGLLLLFLIQKEIDLSAKHIIYLAFLTSYLCVLLLPSMHERYGYLYEILAICVLLTNRKTLFLFCGLYGLSSITYAHYLFQTNISVFPLLGYINISIFILYAILLLKDIFSNLSVRTT